MAHCKQASKRKRKYDRKTKSLEIFSMFFIVGMVCINVINSMRYRSKEEKASAINSALCEYEWWGL